MESYIYISEKEHNKNKNQTNLKKKTNDTLDLSTNRSFSDVVNELKSLCIARKLDGSTRFVVTYSRGRNGPTQRRRGRRTSS